ncbi:MAG: helix-turn-helix transcriptional regulator [Mariniphaga sp.]|nr:helix-turn-helix transcriptional regulator [Mariniphaga sp.]
MPDSEKLQDILDETRMNAREFAKEIGLDSPQSLYNILNGKHNISNKLARKIAERFPHVADYESIIYGENVQIKNKGINIQSENSEINVKHVKEEKQKSELEILKKEIAYLKTMNKNFKKEIDEYRQREKTFLMLLNETKKPKIN